MSKDDEQPDQPSVPGDDAVPQAAERQDPATGQEPGERIRVGHHLSYPLVAVGASAGGLDALEAFVGALPAEPPVSIVILTHGDPRRVSHMAEILERHTDLPIEDLVDGTRPQLGNAYVCPVGKEVTMDGGVLHVGDDLSDRARPIDQLFRSMAEDQGSRVIGVVLSGALNDGTLGLREIQGRGGVTFAQDESTAPYPDMPGSAIASGYVDIVAPPAGIAEEILRVAADLPITQSAGELQAEGFTEDQLREIFGRVQEATGVDFSQYKRSTLLRRLERRMVATGANDPASYLEVLRSDPGEAVRLHDDALIHVTGFFRDPELYDVLRESAFPRLVEGRDEDRDPIRVWVPGCATGEEAYSLAITLDEYLHHEGLDREIQIFGTDLSAAAIATARKGRYPEAIEQDVSPERLRRYFVQREGGYQVRESIRNMCIFARQDITQDPPFSNIDLISCRNVLIYLEASLQERVAGTFHYALVEGGLLVLGSAESVERFGRLFKPLDTGSPIYRRADVETPHLSPLKAPYGERSIWSSGDAPSYRSRSEVDLRREADQLVLERYAPPGVVLDEHFEILQFRGDTGPFLSPAGGQASLNLMRMAPQPLAMAVRRLIDQVKGSSEPASEPNVRVDDSDGSATVDLRAIPLPGQEGQGSRVYLVLFEPRDATEAPQRGARIERVRPSLMDKVVSWLPGPVDDKDARIEQLEDELATTQDYLQSIVEEYEATTEELRSANEEALSTNEELQSTNEELETAKEELQSTNEELSTLNDELRERNEELQRVNNDLINLLTSVDIPILMVGPDLRIRRFTPRAEELMNLIDTDIGRPLTDLRHPFQGADLDEQILGVLDSLQVAETQVEDDEGTAWHLKIQPYRTADNKIEGAVLVFQATGGRP